MSRIAVGAGVLALLAGCSQPVRVLSRSEPPRQGLVVAHRGAHARAPENSLGSIREAAALGIDMVELDVRTTTDGGLVLMHDETVDRTTDGSGAVEDLTEDEVTRLGLVAPDPAFGGEKVPTLAQAIAAAEGKVGIYLHVKEAGPDAIARALANVRAGSVIVFQDERDWLEALHARAPWLDVLPDTDGASDVGEAARTFAPRNFAAEWSGLSLQAVRAAHRAGGRYVVDVLGDDGGLEDRVLHALDLGADGVQTDEPERILRLLGKLPPEESRR